VVLDDSDPAVSDGDHRTLLDELGRIALEKGVGSSSLVGHHGTHESGQAVVALGLLGLDNAHIDVVAVPGINQAVNLHEGGNAQLRHNVEINYQLTKNTRTSRAISHVSQQLTLTHISCPKSPTFKYYSFRHQIDS
jgi:hypothetical protein